MGLRPLVRFDRAQIDNINLAVVCVLCVSCALFAFSRRSVCIAACVLCTVKHWSLYAQQGLSSDGGSSLGDFQSFGWEKAV